jgi:hypothetical protein
MRVLKRAAALIFLAGLIAGTSAGVAEAATTAPAAPAIPAVGWPACTPYTEGWIIVYEGLYYECKYAEGIGFGWFVVGVEKGCAAVGAPGRMTITVGSRC